ncbi:MAG: ribosomal protein S3 [Candidatus Xenolissoclinum pacificiensis L6]|uniref:Small ribosomal subunit protein uS3 n=1 Tax=Candidatus Xenolissoclinum pacificiensis L6 TaxID=1401685 RepID=W2V1K8_9RICK|nr:MAG: ribosomal protein S3 [Candidatus Xenolissoclinum pacificiensis L6]
MGQKVNPVGFRLVINNGNFSSVWYADKNSYAVNVHHDHVIRTYINGAFRNCAVSNIIIKRSDSCLSIIVHSARPGLVIGPKGRNIEKLKKYVSNLVMGDIEVEIIEVKNVSSNAMLVAKNICYQLEKRLSFKRAMKKAIQNSMHPKIKGIKVQCSGRLSGADIARSEWYKEGSIPLQKLKANIDYAVYEAHTTYGVIGVKVWIYSGDRSRIKMNVNA